jgi:hypothetical protein
MVALTAVEHTPLFWGLKAYEWITLAAILIGPLLAVVVTIWSSNRDKVKDQRLQVLRMLIATHHLPSDPAYQVAINLIPIEFRGCGGVLKAHSEFIASVTRKLDGVNDDVIRSDWGIKSVRLVHEVAKALKYDLRETDLQTSPYSSTGWGERERVLMDSQKAMRDIADILALQSRQLAGANLTPQERKFLGLEDEKAQCPNAPT